MVKSRTDLFLNKNLLRLARSKNILLFIFFIAFSQVLLAQDNYYFVAFKDKQANGFTIGQPDAFLSQKAINRRAQQGIAITEQDLPITQSYRNAVLNQGVEVFEASKWFNGVIIKGTSQEAELLKNLAFVATTTYLAPQNYAGRHSGGTDLLDEADSPSDTLFQNKILNVAEMHAQGYYGQGMTIAVLDGGFRNVNSIAAFNHLFANNRVKYSYDFVSKSSDVYQYSSHGTRVLSFMAAELNNSYQGIAPEADYLLFVTENIPSEYRIEEYYWLIGAERADSAGVDIINTSLGYSTFDDAAMNYTPDDMDGNTTVVVKAAHIASEKGIIVVTSAGNSGNSTWRQITSPADIINGLAVGSVQLDYLRSGFSSFGPSADGRVKPDVVAMGSKAYLVNDNGTVSQGSGTSFSAPQVAALVAGIWQAYPAFSALEILDAVRISADNVTTPDDEYGYGIPSFTAINNYLEAASTNKPILVYPNPVADAEILTVKVLNPSKINAVEIELIDTTGKIISTSLYSVSWSNNIASVEMRNLNKGMYFLKVLFDSESEAFRIVKL